MSGRASGVPAEHGDRNTRHLQEEGGDRVELLKGPRQTGKDDNKQTQGTETKVSGRFSYL